MGAVISVPRFCGAQHRGERHAALDQPCCDALLLPRQSFGLSGFVLCDGAGGSTAVVRSAHASARAAWLALLRLRRELRHASEPRLLLQFRNRLLQRRGPVPLLDHTLLACCWDRRRLIVLQVGDSTLLVRQGGQWCCPLPPAKGDYANQTTFLRRHTPITSIQLWQAPAAEVEAVLAFSDGLESAFLGPARPGCDQLQANAALADLVIREHRRRHGARSYPAWLARSLADPALAELSDDDRTLVIASR
jgi:hypothetical protein